MSPRRTEQAVETAPACSAAQRLHRHFGLRERLLECGGRVPVFEALARCGLPPLFRPLDGLSGAYLPEPVPGVMIAARLPRNRQRFAGACLLGHAEFARGNQRGRPLLLRRSPRMDAGEAGEWAAREFAEEFLLPPWLLRAQCARQNWTPAALTDPAVVYQLALRLGADYGIVRQTLRRPEVDLIGPDAAARLQQVTPDGIKAALLQGAAPVTEDGDVWELTPRDEGATIEVGPEDLFVLRLPEHSGAGFVWNLEQLDESGFAVVRDERVAPARAAIGGCVDRLVTVGPAAQRQGEMVLAERRPWEKPEQAIKEFRIHYRLAGPEPEGWARAARELNLAA